MTRSNRQALRVLALAAAVAMLAAGCRSSAKTAPTTTGGTSTSSGAKPGPFIDTKALNCPNTGTTGINGDTITVGTVRPTTGPYSIYNTVTTGIEKYFDFVNSQGGVKAGDGKTYKIKLAKGDDGYDPSRTPAVVKDLVENQKVFAMVGEIGTEEALSVRDYLNTACVPDISIASGSPQWGNAAQYPWYIAGLPSYALEAHAYLEYTKKTGLGKKVALLYQNDDFGKSYLNALEKFGPAYGVKIVAKQVYDPAGGTPPDAAVAQLASSGADAFFDGVGGTGCPLALKAMPASWKPVKFISITCEVGLALGLAGANADGVVAAQVTYDAGSPTDASAPAAAAFLKDGASVGLTTGDLSGGIVAAGWNFGAIFAAGLEHAKTVDRAGVMNALFAADHWKDVGLIRSDGSLTTNGAKDPWLVEDLQVVQRSGTNWNVILPMTSYNGKSNSYAG
jgi:branched-chain amino acid transport system substrate-binding protein